MASINLRTYICCPASIFELHGLHWSSEKDKGVPCRVKVGPRRFLEQRADLENLELVLWMDKDGQVTYLPHQPADVTTDEDGVVLIDAVALARRYFGKDISFCGKETWRAYKAHPYTGTIHYTEYGLATSHTTWLDISWNHSGVDLLPGTLKLCGHDVLNISWSSFGDACASHSEAIRPLVEEILREPHAISAETFRQALETAGVIEEYGINRLQIRTDRGDYVIDSSISEYIAVSLKDDPETVDGYGPSRRCSPLKQVDIMLELLQASTAGEVRAVLEANRKRGLLRRRG